MFWTKKTIDVNDKQKLSGLIIKINSLYRVKNYKGIKQLVKTVSIELLVNALEEIDDLNVINLFLLASKNIKISEFFLSFNIKQKIGILETVRPIILAELLNDLNTDDLVSLLTELPANLCKKILLQCSRKQREEIKQIKSFDQAQAGSIMNTAIITLSADMTVVESINYLKKKKHEFDFEQEIFVTDENNFAVGKVKIQDLFFWESENDSIKNVMDQSFVSIDAQEDIHEVINLFQKYMLDVVPVLDAEKKILGIITDKDIIPEIIEENMDDVLRIYGVSSIEESYLVSGVWDIVKSRIFWLIILLFSTTFTTLIIDKFEILGYQWTAGISSAMLVPIIPVITDMCGNTGSQTTATVIQSFACNEIKKNDFKQVIYKELKVATTIGVILALLNFARLFIYFSIFPISQNKMQLGSSSLIDSDKLFWLGIVGSATSSISLFLVVICSKLLGVVIPFFAVKFNYDPAAFSTPILTTILDALSALIFFGIGIIFLSYTIPIITQKTVVSGKLNLSYQMLEHLLHSNINI